MASREERNRFHVGQTLFALAAGLVLSHGTARAQNTEERADATPVTGVSFYDAAAPLPRGRLLEPAGDFETRTESDQYRRPAIAIAAPPGAGDSIPRWLRERSVNIGDDWSVRVDSRVTAARRF